MFKYLTLFFIFSSSVSALETNYFKDSKLEQPQRELSIIASKEGYYPNSPTVYVGEKVRLYVTSSVDQPSCLIIKDKEVYVSAKKGEISEAEVFFANPGVYETYCPAGKIKGKIIVLEHPRQKLQRVRREVASKSRNIIKVWRPKDE